MELLLITFWLVCLVIGYNYFHSLFEDMRLGWTRFDKIACALICIAGPAAIVCGLALDFARPMVA